MGAGSGEAARELDLSNILDGGVKVLKSTVGPHVGEEVRRLDGVISSARLSEVVCSGY